MQLQLSRTDAPDVEQIVDQAHQVRELPIHHVERAAQRRILGGGKACDLQPIAQGCERIAQFMRQRGEEFVLAPVGIAQRVFGALLFGDVREQDGHEIRGGLADPEGIHIERTLQSARLLGEARRFAREGHLTIDVVPVLLLFGDEFAHPAASGMAEAGLPLEGGVHFDEAIVLRPARGIEFHFDDAETHVDGIEESVVAKGDALCRPDLRRGFGCGADEPGDRAALIPQRRPRKGEEAGRHFTPHQRHGPVDEVLRFAGERGRDDGTEFFENLRPEFFVREAESLRMLGPENRNAGIVVQRGEFGAPGDIAWLARGQHDLGRLCQRRRPFLQWPQRRS
jgi:hypothetical protein